MAGVTDYVDRVADLMAFRDTGRGSAVPLVQSLAYPGDSGAIGTGIAVLGQRFLARLLTIRGSIPHRPSIGCDFFADAAGGQWQTAADVRLSFTAAEAVVRRQLLAEVKADDLDDEILESAELTAVSLSVGNEASVEILVTSAAGESRVYIQPISVSTH